MIVAALTETTANIAAATAMTWYFRSLSTVVASASYLVVLGDNVHVIDAAERIQLVGDGALGLLRRTVEHAAGQLEHERDGILGGVLHALHGAALEVLVHDPEALVFDEPCTGLDHEGIFYVRRSMRTLAQAGKTVVLVTHYPEDVIPEIQRLVLVKDGAVFADGPKEQLLTSAMMSALFDVPMEIKRTGSYYALVSAY